MAAQYDGTISDSIRDMMLSHCRLTDSWQLVRTGQYQYILYYGRGNLLIYERIGSATNYHWTLTESTTDKGIDEYFSLVNPANVFSTVGTGTRVPTPAEKIFPSYAIGVLTVLVLLYICFGGVYRWLAHRG